MGINFHSPQNKYTYANRKVNQMWMDTIARMIPMNQIKNALDIGCGGGNYSIALSEVGVDSIIGVDYSEVMLEGAKENCRDYQNISFHHGNAYDTGLESDHYDLVLERAVIHHLDNLSKAFGEAYRLLKSEGYYVIQDRTPEDCMLKGSQNHIRGYFFEKFPKLIKTEVSRRYESHIVIDLLKEAGFQEIQEVKLWEPRRTYNQKEDLLEDLRKRIGRSILHELNDTELEELVQYIDESVETEENIIEKDRWTIWVAKK